MAKKPAGPAKAPAIRRQAEERLRRTKRDVAAMATKDVQQLVYELQVHQIELEMQNDELRRARVELEAAHDRYADLYEFSPVGHLTLDAQGHILKANLMAATLLGLTRSKLSRQLLVKFIVGEDRDVFHHHVQEVLQGGTQSACEVRLGNKPDIPCWVLLKSRATPDELGRVTHWQTALLDSSVRKQAEAVLVELNATLEQRVKVRTAQLAEANERWDWVVRATQDGVWDWDLLHDTAYFSPRWKEMHGFQESDRPEPTKEWATQIHPEDRPRVMDALERCRTGTETHFHEEYRVQKKDGIYVWVLDRGIAIFNDEGRAVRMIGAESDITWRKESETLLHEREAQLRDLGVRLLRAQEEEQRRISMDLHDDVMQRMGALTLDLYGLVSSAASPDGDLQSQLKACGASAEQLTTDLQRIAHQLHPSILEFVRLEVAAREHVHEFAKRTGVSVEFLTRNLPKNIPLDQATCLYRVLQEGLQNVQKHADATTVLVRLLGTGRGVGLCVHDDGRGMEWGDLAARRKGLGLSSMAERVRMLNGTFRVRTKPGDGMEIHAWVPLEADERDA